VIAEGEYYGMQTFDQALLKKVLAGEIDEVEALDVATSPHDFKLMLAARGQRASGIEQVMGMAGNGAAPEQPQAPAPGQHNGASVPQAPAAAPEISYFSS
jgi:twitching motility protein PilT